MLGLFLGVFQILSLVTGNPLDTGRYLVDSRPLLFVEESENESQVVNSTLVLKKKDNTGGPVYYTGNRDEDIVNNHHIDAEAVIWRRPYRPITEVFSNHRGPISWNRKKTTTIPTTTTPTTTKTTTTKRPLPAVIQPSKRLAVKQVIVNNHNPSSPVRSRPLRPSSLITVVDPPTIPPTDLIGDRIKAPDTIKSATIKVLDAPSHLKTTIKHNKIIVIQKRADVSPVKTTPIVQETTSSPFITTTFQPTEVPDMGNFSVAPVMDIWSNIPIPSKPAWATQSQPVKGGASRPVSVQQSPIVPQLPSRPVSVQQSPIVPQLPFMSFITSMLSPLLSKPLSSSAVNSGMQGIKAMQGFLRNSLMGAMFCFLPSAFIALSLTATQRAQLRKIPEVDDMMVFCKKCLENLKEIRELAKSNDLNDLSWMNEAS